MISLDLYLVMLVNFIAKIPTIHVYREFCGFLDKSWGLSSSTWLLLFMLGKSFF